MASAYIHVPVKQEYDDLVLCGFQGEEIVIELTRIGFDTCWHTGLRPSGSPVCGLFGETSGGKSFGELFVKKGRKPFDSFFPRGETVRSTVMIEVLEATILAPLATKRQPWRFEQVSNDRLLISVGNAKNAAIRYSDLGIALYHAFASARESSSGSTIRKISERVYELWFRQHKVFDELSSWTS